MGSAAGKIDGATKIEGSSRADRDNLPSYKEVISDSTSNKLPPYSLTVSQQRDPISSPMEDANDPGTFGPCQYIIEPTDEMHRRVEYVYNVKNNRKKLSTYCVKPVSTTRSWYTREYQGYKVNAVEDCFLCKRWVLDPWEDRPKTKEATEKFKKLYKEHRREMRF
jgi:hypothetical protein